MDSSNRNSSKRNPERLSNPQRRSAEQPIPRGPSASGGPGVPGTWPPKPINQRRNSVIMGNIEGLKPRNKRYKVGMIKEMAIEKNAQIISLTETHLNNEILDAEVNIEGFNMYRADRTQTTKGGVAVYIRREIAASAKILKSGSIGKIEYICIYILEFRLMIITMYRSPESNSEGFQKAITEVDEAISPIAPVYPTIMQNGGF